MAAQRVRVCERGTPLHLAACHGHAVAIRALLDASASPEARNTAGETPLHAAAKNLSEDAVRTLIRSGANVCLCRVPWAVGRVQCLPRDAGVARCPPTQPRAPMSTRARGHPRRPAAAGKPCTREGASHTPLISGMPAKPTVAMPGLRPRRWRADPPGPRPR